MSSVVKQMQGLTQGLKGSKQSLFWEISRGNPEVHVGTSLARLPYNALTVYVQTYVK